MRRSALAAEDLAGALLGVEQQARGLFQDLRWQAGERLQLAEPPDRLARAADRRLAKLVLDELNVEPALLQEVVVLAALHDLAGVQDDDLVSVRDGAEPLSDLDYRAVAVRAT